MTTAASVEAGVDNVTLVPRDTGVTVTGEVSAKVTNEGSSPVGGTFQVLFFSDTNFNEIFDAGKDTPLGSTTVTVPPAAGSSIDVTATLSGSVGFANAPIWAFVDSDNVIAETDEDNNVDSSVASCTFVPPVGQFDPVVKPA